MKIKIIGSGGCVSTPRPCCDCRVCKEAREKGFPYARTGCSIYIEEIALLIDTPEDINYALNHAGVSKVEHVLYSHADPDHTMGMRVFEQLKMDWLGCSVGKMNEKPIEVQALPKVIEELREQKIFRGSVLDYYEWRGLVTVNDSYRIEKGDICIDLIPVNESEEVAVFVITQRDKKVIYAPCDVKPFPKNERFMGADVLIIGNTIVGNVLKDGFVLEQDNPLREELFVMEEIEALKAKYGIKQVIITHLEEDWGKSYDDYVELEKEYEGIRFAYDGMEVEL
ncbi:MAG: MBL fold metallo-hydrolase [Lachnospiraceae bacterium]|nr:MBL fold metallo-hydrolase [Lachnospiraceae bacterium]